MGPFIVGGIDPQNQQIDVRINGKTVSSYNKGDDLQRRAVPRAHVAT
jgi:hypothetical protein